MARYILSSPAEQDLAEILTHIAKDDPRSGIKFVDKLESKCELLAENAEIGKPRPDLGQGVRTFVVGSYLIIYRPVEEGVEVARIVSGYRKLDSLFN